MKEVRSIKEAELQGKRAILRADFDVVMRDGRILDDFRIRQVLPTLRFLLQKGAHVRIVSYVGRPNGVRNPKFGMARISRYVERLSQKKIIFIPDILDREGFDRYNNTSQIIFFENIRFWPEEEKNDKRFALKVSKWGDIFINEAFANAHRNHACVSTLARLLPSYAGFQLESEVRNLSALARSPKRPFVALLGGAKLETKLPLITRFIRDADHVLLGGALANTLFLMQGKEIGKSTVGKEGEVVLKRIFTSKKICLPGDLVVASRLHAAHRYRIARPNEIKQNEYIADIGPRTINQFSSIIQSARTVVWNGPLGFAEVSRFAEGTRALAKTISSLHAFKVVGGGDTLAVLKKYKLLANFSHVSTGGGAMLEYLAGKKLPGIEALKR